MPQLVRALITMPDFELDHPPFRLSGTVIAALLNHEGDWRAIGPLAGQAPYNAPPRLPVLGVRPPTALARDGAVWQVPAGAEGILAGATLGIVIGRPACRIPAEQALAFVAGYLVVNDGSLPVSSHYRPAMRQRVRDGLCVLGTRLTPACAVRDPDGLEVSIRVDGRVVQTCDTGHRVRGVSRLVADVSAFMTLSPGDLLLLGAAPEAPLVRVDQTVSVALAGLGEVVNRVVPEPMP
jgi:5-oxopent-3-ene-1,2,5-tricarboxylate decarboxylase/2-hydroxyhepta-2,4-diene-1,7-dioate isomerase